MSVHTLFTIVIAVAVVAFVTFRQTRWQPVNVARLLRMPAVFAVVGAISLIGARSHLSAGAHLQALDVVILTAELVLGVTAGWLMGRWTEISTVDGVIRSRLVGAGIAVWVGFIVLRIGLAVLAQTGGAAIAELPGTIFLVLAVVKTLQALIVRERIDRHHAAARQQSYAAVR